MNSISENTVEIKTPVTEFPLTPEFIRQSNFAYCQIYEKICAADEQGVVALFLAYRDILTVGDAYDLMQTLLCTKGAQLAAEIALRDAVLWTDGQAQRAAAGVNIAEQGR